MSDPVPDFTGRWKQVRNENADGYLKTMGVPFVIRRVVVPVMGRSTDIVKQAGDLQVVTTINAKGAWTRKYIIGQEVKQKNAEGDETVATTWWEAVDGKMAHKSRMSGGKRGLSESWRWFDGGLMVVKSIVHCKGGKEAWMLWYFESIDPVRNENFLSAKEKLKKITKEQKLIAEVTEKQTEEMKSAMKDLSLIQQAFVTEMLNAKKKTKEEATSSAASKWKKNVKGKGKVDQPDISPNDANANANANDGPEEEEFFDCLTEEQNETLSKEAKKIDQVSIIGADPVTAEETKMFLCIPVKTSSKVKRLPTVVLRSLTEK